MNEITNFPHYTQSPIESLTAIDSMLTGDSEGVVVFCGAQVVKYLWWMPNNGSPLIDVKKADLYLHRQMANLRSRNNGSIKFRTDGLRPKACDRAKRN